MDPQLKARWGARNAKILIDPFLSGNRDNGWSGYHSEFRARRVVAAWPCNRNRQSVNGQEEWIDGDENTLIAGVVA
jgi:hypothetical protein